MLGNIGMAGSVNDQGCAMWAPDGFEREPICSVEYRIGYCRVSLGFVLKGVSLSRNWSGLGSVVLFILVLAAAVGAKGSRLRADI